MGERPRLSIVIPTLNEAGEIEPALDAVEIALNRCAGLSAEVVIVDGGSTDGTREILERRSGERDFYRIGASDPGRAKQMNAGAAMASGEWLFFLHADSRPSPEAFEVLDRNIDGSNTSDAPDASDVSDAIGSQSHSRAESKVDAFTFRLRFRDSRNIYRRMERGVAFRTEKLRLPYGDQGFAMRRDIFDRLQGFREEVRLEDLDLVLRIAAVGLRIEMLPAEVSTSVRQWERQGVVAGILFNIGRMASEALLFYMRGEYLAWRRAGITARP